MRLFFGWRNECVRQPKMDLTFFILGFSEFEIFIWYFGDLEFDDFAGFEKMVVLKFLIFGF